MSVIKSQTESSESYSCTFDDLHDHFHHTDVNKLLFLVDEPQLDSGTNKNAIDNKTRLRDYVTITAIPDYGVEKKEIACHLIGHGYFDLPSSNGSILSISIYYSPEYSSTITSPNAVVWDHPHFTSWSQTRYLDTSSANVTFFNRGNKNIRVSISLHVHNSLWYATKVDTPTVSKYIAPPTGYIPQSNTCAVVNLLWLWHQRLLHAGHVSVDTLHKCVHGVPH